MMPDKRWLNKYLLRSGMMYKAVDPSAPEFEYIRKDALLEWAKERMTNAIDSANNSKSKQWVDFNLGREDALKSLIDKLNTL